MIARGERGICIHGGESCYLCDAPIRDGDGVVFYFDSTFWEQAFFYHAGCWDEAELAAKDFGAKSVRTGRALVLPEVRCTACGEAIEIGDEVARVRGGTPVADESAGGRSLLPRVYHIGCYPQDPAAGRP